MNFLLALTISIAVTLVCSEEKLGKEQDRDKRSSTLARMPLAYGKRIPQRPMRSILDRMGAGYGKRGSDSQAEKMVMSADDLVSLIMSDSSLAQKIVRNYIDMNGDGVISLGEL